MTTNDLGWLIAIVAVVFALGMYVATRRPITINNNPVAHAVANGRDESRASSGGGVKAFLSKALFGALLLLLGVTAIGTAFKVDAGSTASQGDVTVLPPIEQPIGQPEVVVPTPTIGVRVTSPVVADVPQRTDNSATYFVAIVEAIVILVYGLRSDRRRPRLRRVKWDGSVPAEQVPGFAEALANARRTE